jgi:small-conductance mechanosensitive channel
MSAAAFGAWLVTALLGLYMFTIWLIEDDESEGEAGIRRLRAPVVFSHAGLAFAGLACWFVYLKIDVEQLAWAAAGIVVIVAVLGATMFTRWMGIRRIASAQAALAAQPAPRPSVFDPDPARQSPVLRGPALPPERNFPVSVVALHGICAVLTVVLVLAAVAFG